jgi:hypothetical protein
VSGQLQGPSCFNNPLPCTRKETPRYLLDMRISVPYYKQGIDSFPLSCLSPFFLSLDFRFFFLSPHFICFLPSSDHDEFCSNTEATYSRQLLSLQHTCICNSYSVVIKTITMEANIIFDRSQEHCHVTL